MDNIINTKHWFALYIKPKHEFKSHAHIEAAGIEAFLPTVKMKKKWSDRIKTVTEPLFKGYLFIYADEKERLNALTATGVVNTVSFQGKPAAIPGWQIDNLKKMLEHPEDLIISDRIPAGTLVKVTTPPFAGLTGIVEEQSNSERYISVSIEIINRTVSVKLPSDSVVRFVEKKDL